MAIGARITSENLSGKTATVTFVPYTGITSGTTVNLGTKTIPFNNISTHPYGVYSLYFAEYDYTYTLTIPQPVTNAQLFVYTAQMADSDNFGRATLNFNDFTATIFDFGLDHNIWDNRDIDAIQNGGFLYRFKESATTVNLWIFTDANNDEIGRYSGETTNLSTYELDNKYLVVEDGTNGVLKYSNGIEVFTYTWDPLTHNFDTESEDFETTGDGCFIIKKFEKSVYNGDFAGESYIVNPNSGDVTLFKTWTTGQTVNHKMQPNTDFIVVERRDTTDPNISSPYLSMEICDTSGTVLETVSLTGLTYNSRNDDFLNENKYCVVYHNYDDNTVDYKIIHYNGITGVLTETSHVKGDLYHDFNMNGDDNYYPDDETHGGVVLTFKNNVGYVNSMNIVSYCDIVYMLDNQSSFSTYTFADDETKAIYDWGHLSSTYKTSCDPGSGALSFLTIRRSEGVHIESVEYANSDVTNNNLYYLGEKTVFVIAGNNNQSVFLYLINESGLSEDFVTHDVNSSYAWSVNTDGNLFYGTFAVGEGYYSYYMYSGTTGFTSTDYYSNYDRTQYYGSDTWPDEMAYVLTGDNNTTYQVLSSAGMSAEFNFPQYADGDKYIEVGKDKFIMLYRDTDTNNYTITLYDFFGNIKNSTTTPYTSYNDLFAIGDRYVVEFYNGESDANQYFLVSEDVVTSVFLKNNDVERSSNDWFFEDDY